MCKTVSKTKTNEHFCKIFQLHKKNIYSSRVTRKERNRVGTKFSEGQLFIFRDRQDSCLPSAARLDSPGD